MNYETVVVAVDLSAPPSAIDHIFQFRNDEGKLRDLKNNLVFVAADQRASENMLCQRLPGVGAIAQRRDAKHYGSSGNIGRC